MRQNAFKTIALVLLIGVLAVTWQLLYKDGIYKAEYPQRYASYVEKYAGQQKIDQNLVYAVIKNESGFHPQAQSSIGARGLMQLTQETFEWAQMLSPTADAFNNSDLDKPEVNIKYGTVVLAALIQQFGDKETALAAYHAGQGNVRKWLDNPSYSKDGKTLYHIPFANTRAYVSKVLETERVYHNLYQS